MTTTTCQNHAVTFMATEQHFLIKIYGYFKHFITRREMIALLIKKAKLKPCQEIGIGPNA